MRWAATKGGVSNGKHKRSFCTPKLPRRCRRLRVGGRCLVRRCVHETRPNGWVRASWGRGLGVQNRRVCLPLDPGTSGGPSVRSIAPFLTAAFRFPPGVGQWVDMVPYWCLGQQWRCPWWFWSPRGLWGCHWGGGCAWLVLVWAGATRMGHYRRPPVGDQPPSSTSVLTSSGGKSWERVSWWHAVVLEKIAVESGGA